MLKAGTELQTLDYFTEREMYTGPWAFLKANSVEYFKERGFAEACEHPDGIYGWSRALRNPPLKVAPLACDHEHMTVHPDSLAEITSTLVLLQRTASNSVQGSPGISAQLGPHSSHCGVPVNTSDASPMHLSRHASSLAVPQEDSMCGDGPGPPGDNDKDQTDRWPFNLPGHSTDTEVSLPDQQPMDPAILQGDVTVL